MRPSPTRSAVIIRLTGQPASNCPVQAAGLAGRLRVGSEAAEHPVRLGLPHFAPAIAIQIDELPPRPGRVPRHAEVPLRTTLQLRGLVYLAIGGIQLVLILAGLFLGISALRRRGPGETGVLLPAILGILISAGTI